MTTMTSRNVITYGTGGSQAQRRSASYEKGYAPYFSEGRISNGHGDLDEN